MARRPPIEEDDVSLFPFLSIISIHRKMAEDMLQSDVGTNRVNRDQIHRKNMKFPFLD